MKAAVIEKKICLTCRSVLAADNQGSRCGPCEKGTTDTQARLRTKLLEFVEESSTFASSDLAAVLFRDEWDLVQAWLKFQAPTILGEFIRRELNSWRGAERLNKGRWSGTAGTAKVFADASIFQRPYTVTKHGLKKRLGQMNGADHSFVADQHGATAKRAHVYEDLHRLIAKKVGDKTTEEVFTEEQLKSLFKQYVVEDEAE